MGKIVDRIKAGNILISDGAWGTFLQAKGLKAGECPEMWNVSRPEAVLDIARSYIEAGADMIETNSFGGSSIKLAGYGLADRAYELNFEAARLSRAAAGQGRIVLGSIGPCGKMLLMGETTPDEMLESFAEQAKALDEGGVDAILIETMTDLEEAAFAVQAARKATDKEVFCTMTFDKTIDGSYRTMMGVSPEEMTEKMVKAGAEMIGANCGNGIKDMIGIVRAIRAADSEIPILIHANAGMPVYKDGATVFPETPEEMCALAPQMIEAGANAIGGCCGTTPEHIRQLATLIRNQK